MMMVVFLFSMELSFITVSPFFFFSVLSSSLTSFFLPEMSFLSDFTSVSAFVAPLFSVVPLDFSFFGTLLFLLLVTWFSMGRSMAFFFGSSFDLSHLSLLLDNWSRLSHTGVGDQTEALAEGLQGDPFHLIRTLSLASALLAVIERVLFLHVARLLG